MSRHVKVQGQHFTPWTGVFKELLDFRTVVGNIIHMRNCRRMTFFYLTEGCWFPFKSWQKQMMRKSTLIEITHKHPLHMTAVSIPNPTQPLYNGIISLEGFPGSAQIGKVKLIPTTIPHADYGQKFTMSYLTNCRDEKDDRTSVVFTELSISNCCACTKLRTYPGRISWPSTLRALPANRFSAPHLWRIS